MRPDARHGVSDTKFALSIAVMTLLIAGMGIAFSAELSSKSSSPPVGPAPFTLTLMITTNNLYDPVMGEQPAYYVVGTSGLQSSSNITLPANQPIRLVIVDYDNGAPGVNDSQVGQVTGTTNNQMQVVNNTLVNSTISSSGIEIRGCRPSPQFPPARSPTPSRSLARDQHPSPATLHGRDLHHDSGPWVLQLAVRDSVRRRTRRHRGRDEYAWMDARHPGCLIDPLKIGKDSSDPFWGRADEAWVYRGGQEPPATSGDRYWTTG